MTSGFSVGENMLGPLEMPGADCGESASVSSRNGFVDLGRSGRELVEPADGDRARFRKGLLEPKLAAVGETWSVRRSFHVSFSSIGRFLIFRSGGDGGI